jgi:septal ring factor EnvC (AmiA/AmiB activator)
MMARGALTILPILAVVAPAVAQDIRGIEDCTAEKAMERRTSCLQSNVDFLQQALARQRRETRAQLDAMSRAASAQKAEIEALRSALAKLERELAELRKDKPAKK